jgi:hypothetical protein
MRNDAVGFFWDDTPPPKPPKKEKEKRQPPEAVWLRPDYLPGLEEALRFPVELMTVEDMVTARRERQELLQDTEVYPNYFLATFTNLVTGKVAYVECQDFDGTLSQNDANKLRWLWESFTIVTFNGINYDLPINEMAVAGLNCSQLKEASDKIIVEELRGRDVARKNKAKAFKTDHMDLIEVAPLFASLKTYAGRLHAPKMQDLPFHPSTVLTPEQIAIVRWYCVNDTGNTGLLRQCLDEEIDLRYELSNEYKVDVRSKSDAQIAEAVIIEEIKRRTGSKPEKITIEPGTIYRYQTPAFIQFRSGLLQWALQVIQRAQFVVELTGSIAMPPEVKSLLLDINGSVYRMGIGGLHSSEETVAHYTDKDYVLRDIDVTSYYPFIILNLDLYPKSTGPIAMQIYRSIVERRINAKKAGNKRVANSLKIVVNGWFGKQGSKYSVLYAPDGLIQTTVTGQLSLLMLIERLEWEGLHVVSANTDGIVVKCPRTMMHVMDAIIKQWEIDTGFPTEETRYLALYSRDVNNYIAVKQTEVKNADGSVTWKEEPDGTKNKGAYANPWAKPKEPAMRLHKNPTTTICVEAVEEFLVKGTPIDHTIRECKDVTKFVAVRKVTGGAVKVWGQVPPEHDTPEDLVKLAGFTEIQKDSWILPGETLREARYLHAAYDLAKEITRLPGHTEYVGSTVRWYYAKDVVGELVMAKSGNKVPRSEGAKPCMVLPDTLPDDIDYDWYITEAVRILTDIGARAPVDAIC